MKSSTARATSKPTTRTTNAAMNATGRERTFLAKSSTMSPEPSPPITTSSGPRRSSPVPIRQSTTSSRTTSSSGRASPQTVSRGVSPPLSSPLEGNSPNKGGNRPTSTTRRQSSSTVKGLNSTSPQQKKQILSHDFLSKTPKSRGPSMLTRSIDDPSGHQLRRHSAPPSKLQDYMSKSHDHGSLATYRSKDRGPKSLSTSQDRGPKSLSTSQDRGPRSLSSSQDRGPMYLSKSQNQGPRSLSKSQDRGFMSKSQDRGLMSKSQDRGLMSTSQDRGFMSKSHDRGSLSAYANQGAAALRKVTVPEYGYDGRRLSTGSRDAVSQAPRFSSALQGALNRRDGVSLQLQMGRSVDSTVSLSTATSSQRQSFRDTYSERRLSALQFPDPVMSQGYRSGDLTPEETSPLDGRAPSSALRGGTKHRQLKSPDFFDVKKVDGDGGVITAVSRMHHKSNGLAQRTETMGRTSEEDHDANTHKLHPSSEQPYFEQSRRDALAGSARKAFSVETDSAIGSSHYSEINYKLEKELSGAQELLEIGSWNDDDEEYLRIYKGERSGDASFVDILEDTTSDSGVVVSKNNHGEGANTSPSRAKKWVEFSKISEVGHQYDNALYEKSEAGSDLGTSTQPSPQASPSRSSADRATSATKTAAVSRISSTSATSIDLNRSTDTTCSTYSQYDNAFWGDPPIKGTFRPWNPNREAEMTPAVPPTRPLPEVELARPQESSVLGTREPVADVPALNESRMSMYNDGLERLTSYMKTASQSARKKRGLSDDLSSSQASGCFDYLVDFLETQQSITDVLVSAHDQTLKNDFAHSAAGGNMNSIAMKRLDSKLTNDTSMLSNRSIESRITDLGSEASWESGKSRSVQTLGTTGKVMDQITEKVDSLSFDSPKHLSTFKFGLKKTTVGAFETITSSDQVAPDAKPNASASAPTSRTASEHSFPQRTPVSAQVSCSQSPNPNLSWRSQTAPNSHNPSGTPSRRIHSDEKLAVIGHHLPSPLSTSTRQIKIVSEGSVESRREEEVATPAASPSMSDKPPVTEFPRKESPRKAARQKKKRSVEKKVAEAPASPTVEVPLKDVKMHSHDGSSDLKVNSVRLVESAATKAGHSDRRLVKHDRDSLSLSLDQANKGCGCNIL